MANHEPEELDRALQALDNPARRSMLRKLVAGPAMVGELNELFAMSAPAVSRHLRILEAADLIRRTRHGTFHGIALNPGPLKSVKEFLGELGEAAADSPVPGTPRPSAGARKKRDRPKAAHRPQPQPKPEPMVWDPEEDEIAKLL